jgi:voltage-gated sodium channel
MEVYSWAWVLFVVFIVLSSFTVLNLFIAIIIDSMQTLNESNQPGSTSDENSNNTKVVGDQREDLKKIQNEIEELKRLIVKLSR